MKLNIEGTCSRVDLSEVDKKFAEYTPLWYFKELKEDHDDLVKKEEFMSIG